MLHAMTAHRENNIEEMVKFVDATEAHLTFAALKEEQLNKKQDTLSQWLQNMHQ